MQSPRHMLSPRTLYCMRAVVMVAVAMAVAEREAVMAVVQARVAAVMEAGKVEVMVEEGTARLFIEKEKVEQHETSHAQAKQVSQV